jgi:hypothetical protein
MSRKDMEIQQEEQTAVCAMSRFGVSRHEQRLTSRLPQTSMAFDSCTPTHLNTISCFHGIFHFLVKCVLLPIDTVAADATMGTVARAT